jgi:signal transduction histidine kinase
MAHEINNPLAGMMQTADVMTGRLTENLSANEKAAEAVGITMDQINKYMTARGIPSMLERICESGERAADIVQNMLSFARKDSEVIENQNITELLDQCIELCSVDYDLKKRYDFRRIKVIREYEESLPDIPCEAGKLKQVLMNIFRNGAEAMQGRWQDKDGNWKDESEEGPRFIVRLRNEQSAGMMRIEISDNGNGMEEDVRKRIFEPFFTTKPPDRGTGLGLSVSYFIITENHKGELIVESAPGRGTKFIIRLPLNLQSA